MTRLSVGAGPPWEPDAEAAVLGAMLLTRPAIREAAVLLRPDDFHDPRNRRIYEAILRVFGRGDPVDELTVAAELRSGDTDALRPWKQALAERLAACGVAANAAAYARLVAERGQERRLLSLARELEAAPDRATRLVLARCIAAAAGDRPGAAERRVVDGGSFLLDGPVEVPALWGHGGDVAWAAGESLLIVGPPGVGKSTLVQQLVLARIGLRGSVLGWPVAREPRRVLYVAADRPQQVCRSMARMVSPADRPVLSEHLVVWRGPLPDDLGSNPALLAEMAREHGAGTVVLDSLKDVALDLVKDDVGARVNHALQLALADGIEVVALHHQRKHGRDGQRPTRLADVYGSAWITAGAGSVILLWGQPGDAYVDLTQLKQPVSDIGPLRLFHDHMAGTTRTDCGTDAFGVLQASHSLTARALAAVLFETADPDRNQIQRARRRLDALVKAGQAICVDGHKGGIGGGTPTIYVASCPDHAPDHADHADPITSSTPS
ncbi:MAG TPA: DnaB-like helicase N-terminal domain-containing protein [Acidimicrobiia bacterium]|nr:DnaB-like helicase N-terminal domain-containing protein [Acidimicrobiia bacterium]